MIVVKNFKSSNSSKYIKGNKGMELESSIKNSNDFYNSMEICFITKKPTPIHIVKVKNGLISEAYFEEDSTLDYYGIYKGKYIEFDCKETNSSTSFPIKNLANHQLNQLKTIDKLGGIAFLIIEFIYYSEYYILTYSDIKNCLENSSSKSIKIDYFRKNCIKIRQGYYPRLYYLEAID